MTLSECSFCKIVQISSQRKPKFRQNRSKGTKEILHKKKIKRTTKNIWSEHAENALLHQTPSVNKIDLCALENSQIDWSKYSEKKKIIFKEKDFWAFTKAGRELADIHCNYEKAKMYPITVVGNGHDHSGLSDEQL